MRLQLQRRMPLWNSQEYAFTSVRSRTIARAFTIANIYWGALVHARVRQFK